jgi:hypothetical protein
MVIRCLLLICSLLIYMSPTQIFADAISDIQISSGPEVCNGTPSSPISYVVYAVNKNATQAVIATVKYDTLPAGQSFQLYNSNFAPLTNAFPWTHSTSISPSVRMRVGCTFTYRASPQPGAFIPVALSTTVANAAYVTNPGPPIENALSFGAFYIQPGLVACPGGRRPPGTVMILNLHPYAHLVASVALQHANGTPAGSQNEDVPPLTTLSVGCSNGESSPTAITSATLVYPPNAGGASVPNPPTLTVQ